MNLGKAITFPPITYISIAIHHVPKNVSCYVSTTSWAEFAKKRKKKKNEFIFYEIIVKCKSIKIILKTISLLHRIHRREYLALMTSQKPDL